MPVLVEGYPPPFDPRLQQIKVTPDPGVIEVNVHPSRSWRELVDNTTTLYEQARQCRLGTEKFMLDGRHTGTGGGNHVVLGGPTPADSPFLRRPDLLKSFVGYWLNHPSLSYLFSGVFIGPTSQAPRVDETRADAVYELEIAMSLLERRAPGACPPWLVDRIFRNLLVDVTGNTHRAEFCIDKLYSPDSATGRLGLVEMRAFEMPPHARMSLAQQLLVRALVAWFWRDAVRGDADSLGHAAARPLPAAVLRRARLRARSSTICGAPATRSIADWFAPHVEFRFPVYGRVVLRRRGGGAAAGDRALVRAGRGAGRRRHGALRRFVGRAAAGARAGPRARALRGDVQRRAAAAAAHRHRRRVRLRRPLPRLAAAALPASDDSRAHAARLRRRGPARAAASIGGCTYHVAHPGGRNYETLPVNSNEAEARRRARFFEFGHTPGAPLTPVMTENPEFPSTLDLRRQAPRRSPRRGLTTA